MSQESTGCLKIVTRNIYISFFKMYQNITHLSVTIPPSNLTAEVQESPLSPPPSSAADSPEILTSFFPMRRRHRHRRLRPGTLLIHIKFRSVN